MRNFELLREEARFLSTHMKTVWQDYDFQEISNNLNSRVPKIEFDVEVKVMFDEVHHYKNGIEIYVREYQIEYNGNVYIFEILTHLFNGSVRQYQLDVSTPAGDGVGGKYRLFSEKI